MTEQQRLKQRAYRAVNAEKIKANRKRYMDENKEMINKRKKLWRESNLATVKQMNKSNHIKRKALMIHLNSASCEVSTFPLNAAANLIRPELLVIQKA